jgi:hypothetical protein
VFSREEGATYRIWAPGGLATAADVEVDREETERAGASESDWGMGWNVSVRGIFGNREIGPTHHDDGCLCVWVRACQFRVPSRLLFLSSRGQCPQSPPYRQAKLRLTRLGG